MKKRPSGLRKRIPKNWFKKGLKAPAKVLKKLHGRRNRAEFRAWRAWRLHLKHIPVIPKRPKPSPGLQRREKIIAFAHTLVGITEVPSGSNNGPRVREIQSATGAYGAPWCVSTVQRIWKIVLGSTWADDTAGAYYLADYAARHGAVIANPVAGCAVVYHIGSGHAGTVVKVGRFGSFTAIEGNEGNAVRIMTRNKHLIRCTFILRPELH